MSILQLTACTVDLERRLVQRQGRTTSLTAMEGALLTFLWTHRGRDISRQELLREVWQVSEDLQTRAVDSMIRTLRKKLEATPSSPDHILGVYGVGYHFVLAETPKAEHGESWTIERLQPAEAVAKLQKLCLTQGGMRAWQASDEMLQELAEEVDNVPLALSLIV